MNQMTEDEARAIVRAMLVQERERLRIDTDWTRVLRRLRREDRRFRRARRMRLRKRRGW